MKAILFFLLQFPQILLCQNNNELEIFEPLMGSAWKAEGKWGNGTSFQQEIRFAYALDSNLVITQSKGFVDKAHQRLGDRNHGIRKYDPVSKEMVFWEFDIFGGTTTGTVKAFDKDILYQYQYGESFVSEIWEYVDDTTYNFKVGNFADGEWKQMYLSTQFKRTPLRAIETMYENLKNNLVGAWSSKAWDGLLNESWTIDQNGHLTQTAQYLEGEQVLFESANKIELVNDELILFSVIKDSNPKIFKATFYSKEKIVFENSDYKNPNKVVYHFTTENEFQRVISGTEKEAPTSYTFKFKKAE